MEVAKFLCVLFVAGMVCYVAAEDEKKESCWKPKTKEEKEAFMEKMKPAWKECKGKGKGNEKKQCFMKCMGLLSEDGKEVNVKAMEEKIIKCGAEKYQDKMKEINTECGKTPEFAVYMKCAEEKKKDLKCEHQPHCKGKGKKEENGEKKEGEKEAAEAEDA